MSNFLVLQLASLSFNRSIKDLILLQFLLYFFWNVKTSVTFIMNKLLRYLSVICILTAVETQEFSFINYLICLTCQKRDFRSIKNKKRVFNQVFENEIGFLSSESPNFFQYSFSIDFATSLLFKPQHVSHSGVYHYY